MKTVKTKPHLWCRSGIWHCQSVDGLGKILQSNGATALEACRYWDERKRIRPPNPMWESEFVLLKRGT